MRKIKFEDCKAYILEITQLIDSNKWLLIDLDSKTGDGDLGLTMSLDFRKAKEFVLTYKDEHEDIGRFFSKIGAIITKTIPCIMSSLIGTGFLKAGSSLGGKTELGIAEFNLFVQSFAQGVMERGKVMPGDRTLLDALHPAALVAQEALENNKDLSTMIKLVYAASQEGVEATKNMPPTVGKALYHKAQCEGLPDQGAIVGMLIYKAWTKLI
ncbi:hypothetical protein CS063_16470 [Sporanaerobium hydrogeniformans]|uniref:Uncharacterized protein n=1 Tax=Sporanaerobium hydrogeniformans TaxID=3072179 RepID=A0AC61D9B5_9FIRM|nr:dihydroxyacetone kinase subunit L [Sporanaerobium hydrogeniformans]PHV69308.1 hypothetical protein CS063_16470 [Sporanaerobium hydrogeniformans]